MAKKKKNEECIIEINNRKASYLYNFIDTFEAGIQLTGTEIKSIRQGKANLNDAYCVFNKGELFVKNMYIAPYEYGSYYNHETRRDRKLLLKKTELKKLDRKVKERGCTIIPFRLFVNMRGLAKLEIALTQGKKSHDKSQIIKERDIKRDMDREVKGYR